MTWDIFNTHITVWILYMYSNLVTWYIVKLLIHILAPIITILCNFILVKHFTNVVNQLNELLYSSVLEPLDSLFVQSLKLISYSRLHFDGDSFCFV